MNRWLRSVSLAAIATCTIFAVLIAIVPIGEVVTIGGFEFQISREMGILGRQLIIQKESSPVIFIIYIGAAFWIGWAYLVRAPRIFPGVALAVSALLIGALTVEPFLYAAMVIELIALIFVPLLVQPGQIARKGVLRFITFCTLGMPFLLIAGWMLTGNGLANNPFEQNQLAVALLGIGFVFLLAIFPFHSWVPMIMEETHPFTGAFVIFFLSQASIFLVHGLAQRYGWIGQSSEFTQTLRIAGIFVIATNGFFLAFQRNLGRILGFYILAESGYALLALGIYSGTTISTFYALAIVRMVTFSMFAYCASQLSLVHRSLAFPGLRGVYHIKSWGVSGVIVCQLCLLGLPLLAGFPVKFNLFQQYTGENLMFYISMMIGLAGALLITLRTLALMVAWQPEVDVGDHRAPDMKLPVLFGSVLLVLFGVVPGVTLFFLLTMLQ